MSNDIAAKKKFKMPDTYLIVFGLIIIAILLGTLIPSGQYDTITDPDTGKAIVDGASFHYVEKTPFTFDDFINCFLDGFAANDTLILGCWIITGLFAFIINTGALDRVFVSMSSALKGKQLLLVPLTVTFFCLTGSTGMLQMQTIALVPVALTIARVLGLDPLVGVALIYCGTYSGYATSPFSPANVVLAQQVAGIEQMSGFAYRAIWWVIFTVVTCWYVMRYAKRVSRDINNSLLDPSERFQVGQALEEDKRKLTKVDLVIVFLVVAGFGLYIYKAISSRQGINYCTGVFILVAIIVAILTKTSANDAIKQVITGASKFTYGGILMGVSGAIAVIMTKTGILHTIVHYMAIPLGSLPGTISGIMMYIVNLVINFLIPSTSGKVNLVMPLLCPLGDVIGVSRQVVVSAYCLADSIGNTIIPTHSVLIALISIAGVPFKKWFKFQLPLFVIWSAMSLVQIVVAVIIGYV